MQFRPKQIIAALREREKYCPHCIFKDMKCFEEKQAYIDHFVKDQDTCKYFTHVNSPVEWKNHQKKRMNDA